MSEVSLYAVDPTNPESIALWQRTFRSGIFGRVLGLYRGTSLYSKRTFLGPYRGVLGGSRGVSVGNPIGRPRRSWRCMDGGHDSDPNNDCSCPLLFDTAAHRDKSREWNVSKQKWNLYQLKQQWIVQSTP